MKVEDLENLLIDLANARPEEGGALIPYKLRTLDENFRRRQISHL